MSSDQLPRPKTRLWRTRLHWHRPYKGFVTPIDAASLLTPVPTPEEVAPYGEILLLEDHLYVLHRDGTQSVRIHSVNFPWSSNALAQWDQIQRWFRVHECRTTFRKALLYFPDGTSRKQKVVHHSDQAGNHSLSLEYKPLRPGVVVEFEELTDYFQKGAIGPAMWGQFLLKTGAPCRRRRLTLAVAAPFALTIHQHHGASDPRLFQHQEYRVYQWDLHNVEGLTADLLPYGRDFLPWIDFSTVPSWKPVAEHLRKELSPQSLKKRTESEPIGALVNELTQPEQSPREKLTSIHRHVASKIRYGRGASDWNNRQVRDSRDVLDELRGDCKDKSALLIQLLERVGIPAQMAVLMTAEDGRTPYLPSLRFNHAIVRTQVEGEDVWIDPAAGPFALGDVPRNVQGIHTLLLTPQGHELVISPLPVPEKHAIFRSYRGELTVEGDYVAQVSTRLTGQAAAEWRSVLLEASPEDGRKFITRQVTSTVPGAELDDLQIVTLEDLGQPLRVRYRLRIPNWARRTRDISIAQLPWEGILNLSGVLAETTRQHPLPPLDPSALTERFEIALPRGTRTYGLPIHCDVACPWLHYRCEIGARAGKLLARRRLLFFQGIIPPEQYPTLRQTWSQAAECDHRDLILIRSSKIREL